MMPSTVSGDGMMRDAPVFVSYTSAAGSGVGGDTEDAPIGRAPLTADFGPASPADSGDRRGDGQHDAQSGEGERTDFE